MAMFGETPESLLRPGLSHEEFEVEFKDVNFNYPPEELEKGWRMYLEEEEFRKRTGFVFREIKALIAEGRAKKKRLLKRNH